MTLNGTKAAVLDDLRRRIAHLERPTLHECGAPAALAFGLPEIDGHLPWGGLLNGALHEITADAGDSPAALGFAAALMGLSARQGPVLWCRTGGALYAPGLRGFGLYANNLIFVNCAKERELLWVLEEALRSGVLAAALAETRGISPTAVRRLQLAAESGGGLGFLLGARAPAATPAVTRWHVAAAASRHAFGPWPGAACWRVALQRCRGGTAGNWLVEWHDDDNTDNRERSTGRAASGFRLAAALRDRPLHPAQDGAAARPPNADLARPLKRNAG